MEEQEEIRMRALVKEAGKAAEIKDIKNDLKRDIDNEEA